MLTAVCRAYVTS